MEGDVYNYIVMFDRGFENIVYEDIKKLVDNVKVQGKTMSKFSLFIIENIPFEKLVLLSYCLGSIREGMILALFSSLDNLEKINTIDIPFKPKKIKIKVLKEKKYESSLIVHLKKKLRFYGEKVDKILVKIYFVEDYIILGIPLIEDYSRRGYKIIELKESINTVLANLLLKSNWSRKISIINLKDGTLPIEAGIIAKNIPAQFWNKKKFLIPIDINHLIKIDQNCIVESDIEVYAYDSYGKNISIAKKNSINALVKDVIHFKRIDIEYLDLLIKEEFDLIIGDFYKLDKKNLKYVIYSSKYLLNENGKLIIISEKEIDDNIETYYKKYKLRGFVSKEYRYMSDKYFIYEIFR